MEFLNEKWKMVFIYSFYILPLILLFILFCLYWIQLLIPVNVGGGHWLMAKVELTLRSIRLYDPIGSQLSTKSAINNLLVYGGFCLQC